jgi:predicted branched-subunit amino acid permease
MHRDACESCAMIGGAVVMRTLIAAGAREFVALEPVRQGASEGAWTQLMMNVQSVIGGASMLDDRVL